MERRATDACVALSVDKGGRATGPKDNAERERMKIKGFINLMGSLLYVGNTRPDVSFNLSTLSRFMQDPSEASYSAAIAVLIYLLSTHELRITYQPKNKVYEVPSELHKYKNQIISNYGFVAFSDLFLSPISLLGHRYPSAAILQTISNMSPKSLLLCK